MRLKTKWLLVSVAGGVLIAAVLLFVSVNTPIGVGVGVPGSLGAVAKVVLWPIAVCLYLSSPGPNIGSAEKHLHEWTPVQDFCGCSRNRPFLGLLFEHRLPADLASAQATRAENSQLPISLNA
jgi:hypothetical protein